MPYWVTSVDRWETAVCVLSSHVSEIENTLSHPALRNSPSNLWLPCVPISPLFFQLLHFLSLHPSLPSVTPPYLGPHSGTQCFPSTGSSPGLISHVVCVSQRSTHTHPSTRNYLWRIRGLLSLEETRKTTSSVKVLLSKDQLSHPTKLAQISGSGESGSAYVNTAFL